MVNASDIYAMGGRPLAIVDTLFSPGAAAAEPLLAGLADGARKFGVPVVGGHTNLKSPYAALSVAVMGRARRLLTSFDGAPGRRAGRRHRPAGRDAPGPPVLERQLAATPGAPARPTTSCSPQIAEAGLCAAAKDISMGGLVGTALMLLEGSGVGATLSLEAVPRPPGVPWETMAAGVPELRLPAVGAARAVRRRAGDVRRARDRRRPRRPRRCQPPAHAGRGRRERAGLGSRRPAADRLRSGRERRAVMSARAATAAPQ